MWSKSIINSRLKRLFTNARTNKLILTFGVTRRSDRLINYFLGGYLLLGLSLAYIHNTWLVAIGFGGLLLSTYYLAKLFWAKGYQYLLSVILGLFMSQFIYQLKGMFEMHFFAFIGSALLITYQNWKLQIPLFLVILVHHILFAYLQHISVSNVYFNELNFKDLPTFAAHVLLTFVICFISGLYAFQSHRYHQIQLLQTEQLEELREAARTATESAKNAQALEARNLILESIGDAFFAVNKDWVVTYWNQMAEKILFITKQEILHHNLWSVFSTAINSESYNQYHEAVRLNQAAHFEDYFELLDRWFEISAYPSEVGLSVYFKDITEQKQHLNALRESEQRYSDVFHFSPLPMWVIDLTTLKFIDVNQATITHYGYSRQELLNMTFYDLRAPEEISELQYTLAQVKAARSGAVRSVMVHRKKNGAMIDVEIQLAPFQFNGIKTSIVTAIDITERLLYIKAVEQQNEKLRSISWMQSHVIRAPLARIMSLIPIFVDPKTKTEEKLDISNYLLQSTNEMDTVIKNISQVTDQVFIKGD